MSKMTPDQRPPAKWPTKRLGDICEVVNGFAFREELQGNRSGRFPFFKVSDMNYVKAGEPLVRAENSVDSDALQALRAKTFPPGTVVFPKVGGALLTNKKRFLGVEATFDNNVLGVVPKHVDPAWLFHYFLSIDLRKFANIQALPSIRQSDIANLEFPCPDLWQQRALATRLIKQLRSATQICSDIATQVLQVQQTAGQIYAIAFSGLIPIGSGSISEEVPPKPWSWHPLSEVAKLESGHTPSRSRPDWWNGAIPWLALPDIRELDGRVAITTAERTNDQGIANSSARVLPAGTVCLSRTASVGFVTILGKPMATSQDFVNWVCGPELDPAFLMHALRASRDYIRSLSSGAVHKTVYMPTLKAFRICMPSLPEQKRIAAKLNAQLATLESLRKQIVEAEALAEALPASILRQVFA